MTESIPFERYRPIVDDWHAFQDKILAPLPVCVWTNTLRLTPEALANFMAEDGLPFEQLGWYPQGFKLPAGIKPGNQWPYLAGLYHVQEEVSMMPVQMLDPQPGERVLDLCAAPGNKTAQIAIALENRGTVIANDINFGRLKALRQSIEWLGITNITTTVYDGGNYPREAGLFDKILVDAPCSCEGTSRRGVRRHIHTYIHRYIHAYRPGQTDCTSPRTLTLHHSCNIDR
ncbi:MAG: RsmB/NOP family class I SAM-dependent RNA methyltransferase [Chloroflexota bacterium]